MAVVLSAGCFFGLEGWIPHRMRDDDYISFAMPEVA
jgi:hypothetical protein